VAVEKRSWGKSWSMGGFTWANLRYGVGGHPLASVEEEKRIRTYFAAGGGGDRLFSKKSRVAAEGEKTRRKDDRNP